MTTYRAAYLKAKETNAMEIVLTRPEHCHFSDEALLNEALLEANRADIEATAEDIGIGDWQEPEIWKAPAVAKTPYIENTANLWRR